MSDPLCHPVYVALDEPNSVCWKRKYRLKGVKDLPLERTQKISIGNHARNVLENSVFMVKRTKNRSKIETVCDKSPPASGWYLDADMVEPADG